MLLFSLHHTLFNKFRICLAPGDFNMHWPLADICTIEIDRWPRGVAPLASRIEDLQRKFEMGAK